MSYKILVVDDEKIMRDILTSFLERENYEVIAASVILVSGYVLFMVPNQLFCFLPGTVK